jgi:hypothetical protein
MFEALGDGREQSRPLPSGWRAAGDDEDIGVVLGELCADLACGCGRDALVEAIAS